MIRATQRRAHLRVRVIVSHGFIGQGPMMRRDFTGYRQTFFFRAAHGFNRSPRRDVRQMHARAGQFRQRAIAQRVHFFRSRRHPAQAKHQRPVTFVHDAAASE